MRLAGECKMGVTFWTDLYIKLDLTKIQHVLTLILSFVVFNIFTRWIERKERVLQIKVIPSPEIMTTTIIFSVML